MQTGSVYGQLQAVLAKLGLYHDTWGISEFINGKQHSKLTSAGQVQSGGRKLGDGEVGGPKNGTKDAFDPTGSLSNASSVLTVPSNIVLPGTG